MFFPENELTNYLSKISTTFEVNTAEAGLLFAAIELDIFDCFSRDPLTLEQLAKKINVKKERLLPLLNGLSIMGLLIKEDGFSFPEEYFPFLKKGGRFYIGKALLRFKWTIENLSNLSKIIKGEVKAKGHDVHDEISTAFYLDFVREFNKPYIEMMASRLDEYFKNAKIFGLDNEIALIQKAKSDGLLNVFYEIIDIKSSDNIKDVFNGINEKFVNE